MRILIAGASGLVGKALRAYLEGEGHQVICLQRKQHQGVNSISWNPDNLQLDASRLEGFDVFINLAGESVRQLRWTEGIKKEILESRVRSTSLLCNAAAQLKSPPKLIINASAVGYYGDCGDTPIDETAKPGKDFLAKVCTAWEEATNKAKQAGIRVVCLRIGVVLSASEGALKAMMLPFKCGLGGPIGSGEQYMSWIAIDDLVRIVAFIIDRPDIEGPVNTVSPGSVKNYEFTKALGRQLNRPTVIPLPAFMVRLLLGQMGTELLLNSQRTVPKRLLEAGYPFMYRDIESAFRGLLAKK